MKRLWVACGMLVLLIALSISSIVYLDHVKDEMNELIQQEQTAVNEQDIKRAEELNQKLSSYWEEQHAVIGLFTRHNEIDQIGLYVSELEQLLEHGEIGDVPAKLSSIQYLLEEIWDSSMPNLFHIL